MFFFFLFLPTLAHTPPSQRYPDMRTMLLYGSAFYSLMFLVTFPAYAMLDETMSRTRSLWGFVEHSLACGMAVRGNGG